MEFFNFNTKIEAKKFCEKVSDGEGYPLHKNSATLSYCSPIPVVSSDEETITGWKVIKDEITEKYN